ncbi:hypothetical protein BaRGS_00008320 [Batillaria attramentaria]|uniref:MICOS complex subunit MIC13 n=1 Tax=Batillaria attramentaria TaxID=370345 RepID=A0ABD0LMJ3_9CAEN
MAVSIVKQLTKLALGVGAVYITVEQGVWSTDTSHGSKVLENVRATVAPAASEYVNKIPSSHKVNDSVLTAWNKGVTTAFGCIAEAPKYGKTAMESTKRLISDK